MKNLENICRVCLSRGSRNIFEKSSSNESQFSIPPLSDNVSSLDRLCEKLRYVTMLKVSIPISMYFKQFNGIIGSLDIFSHSKMVQCKISEHMGFPY